MSTPSIPERIRFLLEAEFRPTQLVIRDDSALHAGHAGAGNGGHYHVLIRSSRFIGLSALARHRAVYAAVDPLMGSAIHALTLQTLAPDEADA
jgi:BolA protein